MNRNTRFLGLLLMASLLLLLLHPPVRLFATSCSQDSQCPTGYVCDESASTCVYSCVENGHRAQVSSDCCSGYLDPDTDLCNTPTTCNGCSNDQSCTTCSGKPACDQSDGACVDCVQDGHAAQTASDCCGGNINQSTGVCETCYTCFSDSGCSACSTVCDKSNETCVSCVTSGDYAQSEWDCCSGNGNYDNGEYQCE